MKICRRMLTSSTQLPNKSFHVVERRMRVSVKRTKMEKVRAKRAKLLFSLLNMQIYDVLLAVVVMFA